ncbi:MAG: hypothetical protein EAZ30_02930 [Betaproteobacteria bacterium]|nr:MAG: hypothetical protein EAZ30_02930 [Betaproteobacteria bacterium]
MKTTLGCRLRDCFAFLLVTVSLLCAASVHAGMTYTTQAWADGFSGYVTGFIEGPTSGSVDLNFTNNQGSNWAFKRDYCGGAASTYYTRAAGQLPATIGATQTTGGLSVTLVNNNTYRFSGFALNSAQAFCFVAADGYASVTLNFTAQVTPTPVISNLRIVDNANVAGGKQLCVDVTPYNPAINSFDWIENGVVRANGSPAQIWTGYTCWDRNIALIEGQNYAVQLRYNGNAGSQTSNTLNLTVPVSLGTVSGLTASTNDTSIPGRIRMSWAATVGATYYNTWMNGNWGNVVNAPLTTLTYTVASGTYHPTQVGSYVQACNTSTCTGWVYVTGTAAVPPPPTCSSITAAASLIASASTSIRLDLNGVANATSAAITVSANGASNTTYSATQGSGGNWYVILPLTAAPFASIYGSYAATGTATGTGGTANCPASAAFTRRAPQNASITGYSIAGSTNPINLTLIGGRSYAMTATVSNTGQSTFIPATTEGQGGGHKVGLSPGAQRLLFSNTNKLPGTSAVASGTLSVPATGSMSFTMQTMEEALEWIGTPTSAINITIVGAPTAATSVAATDGTLGDRVRITWVPGANIGAQHVLRAVPGTPWPSSPTGLPAGWSIVCVSQAPSVTQCDDTTAVAGTTYEYRIFGWSFAAGSQYSGWDWGATSGGDTGFRPTIPTTYPQLSAASRADGVQLNWTSVAGAVTYELERATANPVQSSPGIGNYGALVSTGALTTLDQILVNGYTQRGKLYAYRIRAVNAAGNGPWSDTYGWGFLARATPLPPPTAVTASQGTVTNGITVGWTLPTLPLGYSAVCVKVTNTLWSEGEPYITTSPCLNAAPHTVANVSTGVTQPVEVMYSTTNGSISDAATTTGYANIAPQSLGVSIDGSNDGPNCDGDGCTYRPSIISANSRETSQPYTLATRDVNSPEQFTYVVTTQPPTAQGACAIANNKITWLPPTTQSFAGTTSCDVRVIDKGGATASVVVTVNVSAFTPTAPTLVAATDGTLTRKVRVTWAASVGATSYRVLKNDVQIGVASTLEFEESNVTTPTTSAYKIIAVGAAGGASVPSAADDGYANLAPTSVSATITTNDDTASAPTIPIVVDPNAADQHTFAVLSQPTKGAATVAGNALIYTPNSGVSGSDSFTFSATDRAGETVNGTATVTIACRAPSVALFQPAAILIATDATIAATYSANRCNTNLQALLTVNSANGDTLFTQTQPGSAVGADRSASFEVLPLRVAGAYVATFKLVSDQNTVERQSPLIVMPVTPPQFYSRNASPVENEYFELEVRPAVNANCPLVLNATEAQTDPTKCLIEWQATPAWMTRSVSSGLLTGYGLPSAGTHEVRVALSKWDARGERYAVGTATHTITATAEPAYTFAMDADRWTAVQYLSAIQVSPRQVSGASCRLVGTETEARQFATQGVSVCLVDFVQKPIGLVVRASGSPVMAGRARDVGVQGVEARFTKFYPRGITRVVGSVTNSLDVSAPLVGYDFSPAPRAEYIAGSDNVNLGLTPSSRAPARDTCVPTTDESVALASYQTMGAPRCYVEWVELPAGVSAKAGVTPAVGGVLTQAGQQSVRWRTSVKPAVGELVEIASGALVLNGVVPTPPVFVLSGGRKLSDGRYLAPRGQNLVAKLDLASSVAGQVDYLITDDMGGSTSFKRVRTGSSRVILAGEGALWVNRTITIRASYSDYPSTYTEQTLQALTVPYDFVANAYIEVPEVINDTQTLTAKVSVGRNSATGLNYDSTSMGDYAVYVARRNDDGTLTAVTATKTLSTDGANGQIVFEGISAEGFVLLKLVAVATVRSPDGAFTRTIESSNRTVQVVKGTDIEATLSVNRNEGVAPMTPVFALTFTRANLVALGGIEWWLKRDQGEFAAIPRESGAQLRLPITAPGTYQVKAKLRNKNSQTVAESNSETVVSYFVPKITFAGPTYILSGLPAAITIDATLPCAQGRCPIDANLIAWTLSGAGYATPVSGVGKTVPITATANGVIALQATARAATASASDLLAYARERHAVFVAEDPKPTVAISGPRVVETGASNAFTATIGSPWRTQLSNAAVLGEWTLPGGATVSGSTLNYTLPANETRAQLRYTAWIDGLRDRTSASATFDVNAWTYSFPSFGLRLTQATTAAPTSFKLDVTPDDARLAATMRAQGAVYTYEWTYPPALVGARGDGASLSAQARIDGTYPISVVVRDARGNQQTLSRSVQAVPAIPMALTLTAVQSNTIGRVPLDVTARVAASGGHPDDRIASYAWTLNGASLVSQIPGVAQFRVTEPGTHTLETTVTTRMGVQSVATRTITVVANRPPQCALVVTPGTNTIVTADCRDPDGRIVNYQWKVNGTPLVINAQRISFPGGASSAVVEMTATDDSGATVTVSRQVP